MAPKLIPRIDQSGQIVAVEVLKATSAVQNIIRKNQTYELPTVMGVGRKYGMQLMDEALAELVKKDIISLDQAVSRVPDVDAFKKRL